MKILAPVNEVNEVKAIIEAGADEIYCGVFIRKYARQNGYAAFLNMRGPKGNLMSYSGLREVVRTAHHYSITVSLALNVNGYAHSLYPNIYEEIEQAQKIGVDALIVTDVGLLLALKKKKTGIDIHMGTAGVSFNSQTVKFYEDLGVSRLVLPRDVQPDEAREMIKECPSIKFEAIILRSGCRYINGLCWFSHHLKEIFGGSPKRLKGDVQRRESFACELAYELSFIGDKQLAMVFNKNNLSTVGPLSTVDTCGVCRLLEFHKMGLYGAKIAGRGHRLEQKVNDIRFVKIALSILDGKNSGKAGFEDSVKKAHRQIYGVDCKGPCYYPKGRLV